MQKTIAGLIATSVLLGGCVIAGGTAPATLYDLGPLHATQIEAPSSPLPPISLAEAGAPAWLDRHQMFFRLNYDNNQQPRPYAQNRWVMPPSQLLTQRLKSRIAQTGSVVLSASDGALNVPVLRIEVDDFTQIFDMPDHSVGQLALRASVFKGRALIGQKTFVRQSPSPSANANGGAHALAQASDAAIGDLIQWLATLPLQ